MVTLSNALVKNREQPAPDRELLRLYLHVLDMLEKRVNAQQAEIADLTRRVELLEKGVEGP